MAAGRSERVTKTTRREGRASPRRVLSLSARDAIVSDRMHEMIRRGPVAPRGPSPARPGGEAIDERLQVALRLAARVLAALRTEIDQAGRAAADLTPDRIDEALSARAETVAGQIETRVEARLAAIDRCAAQQLAAIEAAGDFLVDLRDRASTLVERIEQLEVQAAHITSKCLGEEEG